MQYYFCHLCFNTVDNDINLINNRKLIAYIMIVRENLNQRSAESCMFSWQKGAAFDIGICIALCI